MYDLQSWAYCAEERKSASFFLLHRNAILDFLKAQLRSMRFKILEAILTAFFMTGFGLVIWYSGFGILRSQFRIL